ncbi:MAG: PAS domain S-box protein [Gemmataceae bacterium]
MIENSVATPRPLVAPRPRLQTRLLPVLVGVVVLAGGVVLARRDAAAPATTLVGGALLAGLLAATIAVGQSAVAQSNRLAAEVRQRRAAQAALAASAEQYRRLFEVNPHPMWVYDLATLQFLAVNDAAVARYGYSRDEFLNMTIKQIRPAVDVPAVLDEVRPLPPSLQSGLAARHRWKDGTLRDVEISSHPINYGDRSARLVLTLDVTDRRRAEAEARRTAELLRAVSDETTDAVFVKDLAGRYLLCNPAASRFVGKPAADVLGKDDTGLFDADSALRVMTRDRRVMESARAETAEEELTAAGATRTYLATKAPLRDADGSVVGLIGISRDITDRKRAEGELRQAQRRLQHVIASSPAVLFTLAVEGGRTREISWISDNLRDVLGYAPAEALGPKWWRENIHPEEQDRVITETRGQLLAHGHATLEFRFRHRDGRYRWTHGEVRLIRDAAGRATEAVGSWSDVSERRQMEDQLRQAQKMEAVGQLAGGIAHDFNNLLTVINGYSDLLLSHAAAADPSQKALAAIREAGERAAGLTQQLLAFSRKAIIEPKVLDLNALVGQVARMLRRLIGEDITLATRLDPDLSRVRADPGQVEQVVMNLAVNARDAMPQGGRLTIETGDVQIADQDAADGADLSPGRYVRLVVSDTGCGMTDEVKAKIFEPFFTTKGVGKGTGLGLATVYGIVKTYRGHIDVRSEPGAGATFEILLPAAPGSAVRPPATGITVPRGTEAVLLVEDEPDVREIIRAALQGQGYSVLEAAGGEEALRIASDHGGPLDLVVTDVVMPGLGGREVATALRHSRPGLKVLFVSGYTDDAVVRHGISEAADAFLQKPFTPATLAAKVRALLDGVA